MQSGDFAFVVGWKGVFQTMFSERMKKIDDDVFFFIKEKRKRKKRYKISKSIPQITKTIMEPSNHDSLSLFDVTQQQEKIFWGGIISSSFGNSPKSSTYLFSEGPKICRFCWFLQIFWKKVEIYRIYFTQL